MTASTTDRLEIIPLGGAGDIGKNMVALRYADDIIVVDAGVQFPGEEHPGVDLIIPDFSYLEENAEQFRAILLTHGHEDHIGAVPHVLKSLNVPVYGTPFTIGLVRAKLDEHRILGTSKLHTWVPGDRVTIGAFTIEPIHVTHSIPDSVCLAITTPVGLVIHTGDFKVDQTPVDNRHFDAGRLAQLGDQGVLLLISDCVNAERPGWNPSERIVGEVFDHWFREADGRVIVTTFSSNIHRVQQVFEYARKHGRRVAIVGRSMERNAEIARELGFLHYHDGMRMRLEDAESADPREVVLVTTGSQGEPMSALTRMSNDEHKIKIREGDTVILSSRPIPGNENAVYRTVNRLFRLGARVIYDDIATVHVSGHGRQEELKIMYRLTRPKFIMPFHGEPRMMVAYEDMVTTMGHNPEDIFFVEIGDRLSLSAADARMEEPLETYGSILVDGYSEGGVSEYILRDRRHLSTGGTVIVTVAIDHANGDILEGPEIISRGFLTPEDAAPLFTEAAAMLDEMLQEMPPDEESDVDIVKQALRDNLSRFLRKRTGQRPVVVPIVIEI